MDTLMNTVLDIKTKLSNIPGVLVGEWIVNPPIAINEIETIEKSLPDKLPKLLKNFYSCEAQSLKFTWEAKDKSIFGDECKRGILNILSPKEILGFWNDMQSQVHEARQNDEELQENVGIQALVKDWPFWIPIVRFPNGDAFCLEVKECSNSEIYSINFLEHDVMDGGPFIHGLRIATNFEELIERWSKIGFADVFDWSRVTNVDGIDLNSLIFLEINKKLNV